MKNNVRAFIGTSLAAIACSSHGAAQSASGGASGPLGSTTASLGGAPVSALAPPMAASALPGRMLDITLNLPGQTWQERFVLAVPHGLVTQAPLLTLFHGYGEDPLDVVNRTDLVAEALLRGWIVYIPLGAHAYNYGIDYAQENIERTFEILAARLPIDPDRIYAVGFSMGGGAAASFAARHQHPEGVRFAAVVNHTGSTSLRSSYVTQNATTIFDSPLMFGGRPELFPFDYARVSSIEHDAFTDTLIGNEHMGVNLLNVPVRNVYGQFDANFGLVDQTRGLHGYLGSTGGSTEEVVLNTAVHAWSTLDATDVLDWLAPKTLWRPTPGSIVRSLADRSGRWHEVDLELRADDALAPILYSSQPTLGRFYAIGMKNLASVGVDLAEVGLLPPSATSVEVWTQTVDGAAPTIRVMGLTAPPAAVLYRGTASSSWSFDPQTGVLELQELGPANWARWTIVR